MKYKINTNLKQIIENTMKQNAQKKKKKKRKGNYRTGLQFEVKRKVLRH